MASVALAEFLLGERVLITKSSNVKAITYSALNGKLFVEFIVKPPGGITGRRWPGAKYYTGPYRYMTLTPNEAASMFNATSHGVWVWDHLRVRGSATAHQKACMKEKLPLPKTDAQKRAVAKRLGGVFGKVAQSLYQ